MTGAPDQYVDEAKLHAKDLQRARQRRQRASAGKLARVRLICGVSWDARIRLDPGYAAGFSPGIADTSEQLEAAIGWPAVPAARTGRFRYKGIAAAFHLHRWSAASAPHSRLQQYRQPGLGDQSRLVSRSMASRHWYGRAYETILRMVPGLSFRWVSDGSRTRRNHRTSALFRPYMEANSFRSLQLRSSCPMSARLSVVLN
jgi:hypothetical protein